MSHYTTQLRWIVEQIGDGLPVPEGQRYADAVYRYIGLNQYPIFNEEYRTSLNDKIIDHFFFREIGFETAAQFAFYLKRTMNEIMPKYNALYKAQATIDPLHPLSDYDMHKHETWIAHVDDDSQSSNNSQSEQHGRNVFQDTPMSLLDNTTAPTIQGMDYATNVTYDDGSGASQSTAANTRDRDDTGTRNHDDYGNRRSWASLMKEYEELYVNIDMMILDDLETLFMGLW